MTLIAALQPLGHLGHGLFKPDALDLDRLSSLIGPKDLWTLAILVLLGLGLDSLCQLAIYLMRRVGLWDAA